MKKTIKKVFIGLIILIVFLVGYYYSRNIEVTKISLKCTNELPLLKSGRFVPVFDVYYKITKKIFDDRPYRIYQSYTDSNDDVYPPYLIGVSDESLEGRNIKFKKEQFPPTWYTFVNPVIEWGRGRDLLSTVTYINRESLDIESRFTDDGKLWSKGQCSIISNEKFDEVRTEQVKKIKEKMKF